ncbi:MAG TPA: hypothetical protein VGH02_12275 [Rhizomicrobium sp.]
MSIPADQYELYAEFGIASEKAQVLEVEAGNVALSYLTLFVNTDQICAEEGEMFRKVVDDVNRKTLGTLLQHIKSIGTFDPSILQVVDDALERRNYLTHKFFRTHNFAIFDVAGRKAMVEELRDIQRKFDMAHAMLHGVSETLESLAGRGDAWKALTERLRVAGKKVDI